MLPERRVENRNDRKLTQQGSLEQGEQHSAGCPGFDLVTWGKGQELYAGAHQVHTDPGVHRECGLD